MTVGLSACAASCSSASITLQSFPENAEIYVSESGFSNFKMVGKTPLTSDPTKLTPAVSGSGPLYVEFRKEGYKPGRLLVTDLTARELTVSMELGRESGLEDPEKMNVAVELAFEIQRLARATRYDDALLKAKKLQEHAPMLATSYELEGGIYYIQRKYRQALDAFRTAVRLDPRNAEAVRMRNLLEGSLGLTRTPASAPPTAQEASAAANENTASAAASAPTDAPKAETDGGGQKP